MHSDRIHIQVYAITRPIERIASDWANVADEENRVAFARQSKIIQKQRDIYVWIVFVLN